MNTLRCLGLVLALLPLWVRAVETTRNAKVTAVTGEAAITLPGGGGPGAVVGAIVPVGATITTMADGQVTIEFFDGTLTVIQPESNVTVQEHAVVDEAGAAKENTVLELRAGGVVASLDPAKKKITNFKVRTPKGVAAARGTLFAVRISQNATDASVTTMSGTVTFVTDQGEFTVQFGQTSNGGGVSSVLDAVKANPSLAKDIIEATASVAAAVGSGSITNTESTPNLIATVLAAIVDVAVQAAPGSAADIVRDVIAAAGPGLQGANGNGIAQTLATTAIEAATRADADAGAKAAEGIQAAANTAAQDAGVPQTDTTTTNTILPPLDQTQIIVSPSKN